MRSKNPTPLALWRRVIILAIPAFFGYQTHIAIARELDVVFLTCNAVHQYSRYNNNNDRRVESVVTFLKIDVKTSEIYRLNIDSLRYENQCEKRQMRQGQTTIGDRRSNCTISDDLVTVNRSSLFLEGSLFETLEIYRGSGRISGTVRLYMMEYKHDLLAFAGKDPYTHYHVRGMCQKGTDMSNSQRAF